MSEYLMEMIGYQVQNTADWRREKARQFSDDPRNLRAAEELDRLAEQIEQVASSEPIQQQIADLNDSLDWENMIEEVNETVSAELRAIGFHSGYTTAAEFLNWYRDLLHEIRDTRLDAQLDDDLDEQIANDPAVQAAKRAYDEAVAKAYAEAVKHQAKRVPHKRMSRPILAVVRSDD
jgi:hypothetical protein